MTIEQKKINGHHIHARRLIARREALVRHTIISTRYVCRMCRRGRTTTENLQHAPCRNQIGPSSERQCVPSSLVLYIFFDALFHGHGAHSI